MAAEQMAQIGEAISTASSANEAAFKPQIAQAKLMLTAFLVTGR
jgi:triphosphatase